MLKKAVEDIARLKLTYRDLVKEGFNPIFIKGTLNKLLKESGHQPLLEDAEALSTTISVTPSIQNAINKIKEQANDSMETDSNGKAAENRKANSITIPSTLPQVPVTAKQKAAAASLTIPGLQNLPPAVEIPGLSTSIPTPGQESFGLTTPNARTNSTLVIDTVPVGNRRKRPGAVEGYNDKAPKRKFGSFVRDPSLIFEVTDDEDESFISKRNDLLKEKEKVAMTLQSTEESIRALREQLKLKMTPTTTPNTPTTNGNGSSYVNKGKSNAITPPDKSSTPNQTISTPTLEEATAALRREKERLSKQEELAKIRAKLEEAQAQKRKAEEAAKAEAAKVQEQKEVEVREAEEKKRTEEEAREREAAEKQLRNERNRQEAEKKREELLAKLKESRELKRKQEEEAKRKQEEEAAKLEQERIQKEAQEQAKASAPLSKKEQIRLQLEQMEREDRERLQLRQQMLAQLEFMDQNSPSTSEPVEVNEAGVDSSVKSGTF